MLHKQEILPWPIGPDLAKFRQFKIFTPLQKLPKNVGDLGKIIVATGFKKLPKVQ